MRARMRTHTHTHTGNGGAEQLQEVVPEVELIARDQEAGPKKQGSPQAQEDLVRKCILGPRPSLEPHSLGMCMCGASVMPSIIDSDRHSFPGM